MYPFTIALLISTPELWEEVHSALQDLPVRVAFELATIESTAVLADKVERYRPDILILDTGGNEGRLADLAAALRTGSVPPRIVVLDTSSDPQRILAAMRAGASEYLFPPLADTLREALERLSAEHDPQARRGPDAHRGRIVGFLSAKGGCGATTLACHAALEIPKLSGKATALADLDLGSGMVRFFMHAKTRYSVVDAMRNVDKLDPNYWQGLVSNGHPGLEILSAPVDESTRDLPHLHEIRHVLRFARHQYSWLVLDLGHGLSSMTWHVAEELDELLLVSTLEVPALHRAKTIARHLREAGFDKERLRLVLNRVPRRTDVTTEELEAALGIKVFDTVPNDYRALEEASAEDRLLAPDHPLRRRIARIARKLAGAPQETKRKSRFSLFG